MVDVNGRPGSSFDVPSGWEPVADVVAEVWSAREQVSDEIVAAVLDASPEYHDLVSPAELRQSALENVEMMLRGLAERRGARPEEVAVRRSIGRRRAQQGLPTEALIRGFFAGYQALWAALVDAVPDDDAEAARLLSRGALVFWRWVHDVTDALAKTHAAAMRAAEARMVSARDRFVELIETGDVTGGEAGRVARDAGFDVDAPMQVLVIAAAGSDPDAVARVQAGLDGVGGVHAVAGRGAQLVAVSQGAPTEELADAVAQAMPGAAVAVGLVRDGVLGARESLLDARLALSVTEAGRVVSLADEWLWATLTAATDRVAPLLEDGVATAREHPHLAEAITAFADSGFSVTETARRLDLHANSVAYRLERWRALTGWDPRTFAGLARSLAAVRSGADG